MDGSNYDPRREERHDHDLRNGDDPRIVLLVVLLAVVAGTFLFTHSRQVLAVADCLIGTGRSCSAIMQPAAERRPQ